MVKCWEAVFILLFLGMIPAEGLQRTNIDDVLHMSKVQGSRTTIHPRRTPPPPKGREGKGAAEAPSSPSVTPALREKGVTTYIDHCSDLYRSRARPIVVRMRTNIGSLADQYRFHIHSTIGSHVEPIVE